MSGTFGRTEASSAKFERAHVAVQQLLELPNPFSDEVSKIDSSMHNSSLLTS